MLAARAGTKPPPRLEDQEPDAHDRKQHGVGHELVLKKDPSKRRDGREDGDVPVGKGARADGGRVLDVRAVKDAGDPDRQDIDDHAGDDLVDQQTD